MDQLDHDIVQDLLPLYHDGVCSDKSRAAVEEHLQTCQDCRKALEEMDTQLPTEKVAVDDAAAVKKISREWERGKWKARMKGAGIAVLVCLLLFGGWIAATECLCFRWNWRMFRSPTCVSSPTGGFCITSTLMTSSACGHWGLTMWR